LEGSKEEGKFATRYGVWGNEGGEVTKNNPYNFSFSKNSGGHRKKKRKMPGKSSMYFMPRVRRKSRKGGEYFSPLQKDNRGGVRSRGKGKEVNHKKNVFERENTERSRDHVCWMLAKFGRRGGRMWA